MRLRLARFCAGLLLLPALAAADARDDFAAANRLYGAGRYAAALELYQRVSRQSSDWQVAYNIGNCHYQLGDYLQAKVHFLKARRRRPLEASIRHNLAMTNRHFRDDLNPAAPGFPVRARQALESHVGLDALSLMVLAAAALLNAALFRLLTRGPGKKRLYALAAALVLALGLGAWHVARTHAEERSVWAVVREEGVPLRSGPAAESTVLFRVHPGLEVRIIDHAGEWLQVAASERVAGWVEKSRLILI